MVRKQAELAEGDKTLQTVPQTQKKKKMNRKKKNGWRTKGQRGGREGGGGGGGDWGGGEGELSAMQNSSTPHLVILWFGRRFFAFLR